MKPCIACGEPTNSTRCPDHQLHNPGGRARGYDYRWEKLSQRARKLQAFCSDCGSVEDLQLDHTPEAWRRKKQGKTIRLRDVAVVCGPCNRARGAARGENTRGETPPKAPSGPDGKAQRPSFTTLCSSSEVN